MPAHNERDLVARTIESVHRAIDGASAKLAKSCLVIVADRCTDDTVDVAKRTISATKPSHRTHQTMVAEAIARNVGSARSIGTSLGHTLLRGAAPRAIWVANTDADTSVPSSWISDQIRWADKGYAAVAGIVGIDSFDDYPAGVERRFLETYTAKLPGEDVDHPHVHAANMGLRLDAYLATDGWACISRSEDRNLWTQLASRGYRTRAPSSLRVETSGRRRNRITDGFAASLAALAQSGVEHDGCAHTQLPRLTASSGSVGY